MYHEVEFDKELSSNQYVHPTSFTKLHFWKQVIIEFTVLFIALLVTVLAVYGFVAYIVPTAVDYSRTFLIGLSVGNIGNLLIGVAIMYVWLVFIALCLHIVLRYRELVRVDL